MTHNLPRGRSDVENLTAILDTLHVALSAADDAGEHNLAAHIALAVHWAEQRLLALSRD